MSAFDKRKGEASLSHFNHLVMVLCGEVLDRSARLKALVCSSQGPLLISASEVKDWADLTKEQKFLRDWAILRDLRRNVHEAELMFDVSIFKLKRLLPDSEKLDLEAERFFVKMVDRAIDDHAESQGPEATDAVRDLARNYLIAEKRFPFGAIFDERECTRFFNETRWAIERVIQRLNI